MSNPQFTCILCGVTFQSLEVQKVHYRSEWHLYNLKRKIAGFPIVSAEVFSQKVIEKRTILAEESSKFSSKKKKNNTKHNNFTNSLKTQEHEFKQQGLDKFDIYEASSQKSFDINTLDYVSLHSVPLEKISSDKVEEDSITDECISKRTLLEITDCLFCILKFDTLDENLKHMKKAHSLFLPHQEYLTDLEGLIKYLGEKISIGNLCLSCEKVGKNLNSIRQHMVCKFDSISYNTEEQKLELSDYYDFKSSYFKDNNSSDWEDILSDQDSKDDTSSIDSFEDENIMIDNNYELILPSKMKLGHRSLIRYYRQNLNPRNFQKQTKDRNKSGLVRQEYVQRSLQGVSDTRKKFSQKHIKTFQDIRQKENFRTSVAIKSNYQKHFRNELLQ
ncbi:hypothetical protein PMAC_002273 [Pneumocystis sp. 'macacae']|nr:hypothetical protein PMAC_002273 [Pneumocystis sp. 'macacae']